MYISVDFADVCIEIEYLTKLCIPTYVLCYNPSHMSYFRYTLDSICVYLFATRSKYALLKVLSENIPVNA